MKASLGIHSKAFLVGFLAGVACAWCASAQTNAGNPRLVTKNISLGKVPMLAVEKERVISPDKKHVVFPVLRGGKQTMWHDGIEGPEFDLIGPLSFSPNSQGVLYSARRGGKWRVVVDGKEGPQYDGGGDAIFSRDSRHVAYSAQLGAELRVVVDGTEAKVGVYEPLSSPVFVDPKRISMLARRFDEAFEPEIIRVEIDILDE